MKSKSFLGGMVVGALLASMIPYSIQKDDDTGAIEIRTLLWGFRKTPGENGEDSDSYAFAIPPSGLDSKEEETA